MHPLHRNSTQSQPLFATITITTTWSQHHAALNMPHLNRVHIDNASSPIYKPTPPPQTTSRQGRPRGTAKPVSPNFLFAEQNMYARRATAMTILTHTSDVFQDAS